MEIDLFNFKSTWSHCGGGNEEKVINKTFRKTTSNEFIEKLKEINLLNWRAKYIIDACDGTQWSIDVTTDSRTIKKYGDNKFPDEWDIFCRLVRKITNEKFR